MYKAVLVDAFTLIPKVVDVDFEIRGEYIYVVKGGVTGYESATLKKIVDDYLERSVFACWVACMGTLRKYPRLEIPMSEIIKYLLDNEIIEVEKEYGYIKKIIWLNKKDNKIGRKFHMLAFRPRN